MPFLQLTIEAGAVDPAATEEACFALGALAVTLTDASDNPILEPAPGETPLWPEVRLRALWPADANAPMLLATLSAVTGLEPGRLSAETLEDRPWEREWLKDFKPMRFGRRLWVCPGGQRPAEAAEVILELDPGLAFGTGTHPTTALCLEWLERQDLKDLRMLDYGCGSGILALAALRLGASSAWGVDLDPQALIASRDNAERNRLLAQLTLRPTNTALPAGFDLVVANILAGPLVELAPLLAAQCRAGGSIALAGLLTTQADAVATAYLPWFHIGPEATRDGWTVLSGQKRPE